MAFSVLLSAVGLGSCATNMVGVTETPIEGAGYVPGEYNENISILNVALKKENVYMRSGISHSSLVHWDTPNKEDGWSFAYTFNEPNLGSDETAGIYFWYTKEKLYTGYLLGGSNVFDGIVVGVEFKGKLVSIVYGISDGKKEVHPVDLGRDQINSDRFRNANDLTFKLISTKKNLKVEIYKDGELAYDNLRIPIVKSQHFDKGGRYFGLTATYPRAATGKAFILKNAQLYKRVESSGYMPEKIHSKMVEIEGREFKSIKHHDTDVKMLVWKAEKVRAYLQAYFGKLPETVIKRLRDLLERDFESAKMHTSKLEALVKELSTRGSGSAQVNSLDIKIKQIQRSIAEMKSALEEHVVSKKGGISWAEYGVVALGCFCIYAICYQEIANFMFYRNSTK